MSELHRRAAMSACIVLCALTFGCDDDGGTSPDTSQTMDSAEELSDAPSDTGNGDTTDDVDPTDVATTATDVDAAVDAVDAPSDVDTTEFDVVVGSPCESFLDCGVGGFCDGGTCSESECDGLLSAERCADGEKCVPVGRAAYECVVPGPGMSGDACQSTANCGGELVCGGGMCGDVECAADGSVGCPGDESCVLPAIDGYALDFGVCLEPCTPFDASLPCAEGWCAVTTVRDATGQLVGSCSPAAGAGTEGDACTTNDDCDDLHCLGGTCLSVCDPESETTGAGTCTDPLRVCSPLRAGSVRLPFGACVPGCDPWLETDPCSSGSWCRPSSETAGLGSCRAAGSVDEYEVCEALSDCSAGLVCVGVSSTVNQCRRVCDTRVTDGCLPAERCEPIGPNDDPWPYGYCTE